MAVDLIAEAYRGTEELTKSTQSSFYYGMSGLDDERRLAMSAIYAYCRRCDDIVDEPGDPHRKAGVLDAWEAGLQDCLNGRPRGMIYRALANAIETYDVPGQALHDVLLGCRMDLENSRYQTLAEMKLYCDRVASAVGLAILPVFGYSDDKAIEHIADMGTALQYTNILRDVKEDTERDRIYLPLDLLSQHGVTEAQILGHRWSDELGEALKMVADEADRYYESGWKLLKYLPRKSRLAPRLFMGIYQKILEKIREVNYNVFDNDVHLPKKQKARIATMLYVRNFFP